MCQKHGEVPGDMGCDDMVDRSGGFKNEQIPLIRLSHGLVRFPGQPPIQGWPNY